MKINNALLSALTLGILLCGCNFKPTTPQKQISFKADYANSNVSTQWWKSFNDPQLNALIQSALEQNSDLQTALNNVEYARVNLGLNKLEYLARCAKIISATGPIATPTARIRSAPC